VPAALAHADCCGGFMLASEEWELGSAQFEGWAAMCAPEAAGAGAVSLTLLGFGVDTMGGLWVHTPAGGEPPAPQLLHETAECVGVALLRSRAAHAHLRTSVADATVRARADADATLALQRAFLSGITHELRTPLNAGASFALLRLAAAGRLASARA
jgi:signal transduction histidine kinase